jgi:hypothetical protein
MLLIALENWEECRLVFQNVSFRLAGSEHLVRNSALLLYLRGGGRSICCVAL